MNLAREFRALADRFRRFAQRPDRAGLKHAEAHGGGLLIRAVESGLQVVDGFAELVRVNRQRMAEFDGDHKPFSLFCLSSIWVAYVSVTGEADPLAGDPLVLHQIEQTPEQLAAGIRVKYADEQDRAIRAENYANIASWLADRLEAGAVQTSTVPVESVSATAAELIGMVAPDGAQVLLIAQDHEKSAEYRMRHIVALDQQYAGWSSERWAVLLDCKPQAIRKTTFWKRHLRATK